MRLIDADALADDAMDRYCKDCDKRKGIKDGKYRIIYEIGEAPCGGCGVDDMLCELEDAPTVDAVEVVRCKDCKWYERSRLKHDGTDDMRCVRDYCALYRRKHEPSYFCADGERRKDGKTDNC